MKTKRFLITFAQRMYLIPGGEEITGRKQTVSVKARGKRSAAEKIRLSMPATECFGMAECRIAILKITPA